MSTVLRATLTIEPITAARPEDFRARGSVVNDGIDPVSISLAPLSSPSLALRIVDERGKSVQLPPPPIPPSDMPLAVLVPGEERAADFPGFLPSWTPPGRYRAQLHYVPGGNGDRWLADTVSSNWVEFELTEPV
jgi:hypothetical protein